MFFSKKDPPVFEHFERHTEEIMTTSILLRDLFHEKKDPIETAQKIKDHEHIADTVTHAVVKQMSTGGFILPLDREDILALTMSFDEIVDSIDNCAEAFAEVYQLKKSTSFAQSLADVILRSAEIIVDMCKLLRQPSRYSAKILQSCVEIHRLENEGDRIKKEALTTLYKELKSASVDVPYFIAWNDIYHTLESVTDRAEDCANIAEQIVLKYA